MTGQKTNLFKLKKIKIISSIFSDHNVLKLETNLKEKIQKHSNSWRLNSMLLKNQIKKKWTREPWLVWLSGLSAGLWTESSLVQFSVRAHAWVAGQVPHWGQVRGNQWMYLSTMMFLSLSFSLPFSRSKNK